MPPSKAKVGGPAHADVIVGEGAQAMAGPQAQQANVNAVLARAVECARGGRLDQADALLRRLLAAMPRQPDALQLMGLVAGERGRKEEAVGWFRKSLAVNPAQPHVQNNLGNALSELGRNDEAMRAYREAVRLQPEYLDAWINLGLVQAAAGAHTAALESYDRALKLAPNAGRALNARGLSLKVLDRLEEAESAFRNAVRCAPRDIRPLNNLGNVLRELGREADAAECYRQALALAPQSSRLRIALSGACFNLQRFEEAESLLESTLADEPDNLDALRDLASLRYATARAEQVPAGYEAAVQRAPHARPLWRAYAEALWHMARYEEGLAVLDRAEASCGAYPLFEFWRARLMASNGEPEAALARLDPAFEGAEGLSAQSIAVERARAHLRLGSFAQGAGELEAAVARAPDDYTLWAHLEPLWRLAGDERAAWLLDYERFVRPIELPLPPDYESRAAFNEALADTLRALHVSRAQPIDQTVRGGTQTFGRLFHRAEPELRQLRDTITEAVEAYVADLPAPDPEHPFLRHRPLPVRYSGSWSVRLFGEGYHVSHYHPEGWISSAYYVALPSSVADPDTPAGRLEFGRPPVPVPGDVKPVKEIQPRVGVLALFPSYCWHGTVPFAGEAERLTVAFDVARG